MLLLGLSINTCGLSRIFAYSPSLAALGSKYSYPQYVLQMIALAWWTAGNGHVDVDVRYFVLLLSSAVVSFVAIARLAAHPLAWRCAKYGFGASVATYCLFQPNFRAFASGLHA
jgi:hypothetical protein